QTSANLAAFLHIIDTSRLVELLREDLSPDPQVRGTGSPRGRAIFRAASAAGKAADWLLERHRAAQRELAA
ncbi:MAG: hypothetical protein AABZ76_22685, partial [Pseudomonadota bacterium]